MFEKLKTYFEEKASQKTKFPDTKALEDLIFTAESYCKNKQWELAVTEYEKALAIESTNIEIISKIVEAYEKLENSAKKAEYLERQFELLGSNNESIAWQLIDLYEALEKTDKTIELYKLLINLDPGDITLHFKLAKKYFNNEKTELAIEEFKLAADISEQESDWDDAIRIYENLIEIEPDNIEWQRSLGHVLSEEERWNDAISVYVKLIEREPDNTNYFYNLGRTYTELDKYDEAVNYLKKAINLKPDNLDALCYLGTAYQELDQFEESLVYFKKAKDINPDFEFAYFNMAISYIALKDIDNALVCMKHCSDVLHGKPLNDSSLEDIKSLPSQNIQGIPPFKIYHDYEQFLYLADKFKTPVLNNIANDWKTLVTNLNLKDLEKEDGFVNYGLNIDKNENSLVLKTFNQPVYLKGTNKVSHAINPNLDFDAIQEHFINKELQAMTVDNILTNEAWELLLEFCHNNTFWYNLRPGYLGAFSHDGFYSELLFQIATELRSCFPRIFKHHFWRNYWGFKHDCSHGGINVHADVAAINVNFWITPDDANIDSNYGGLLVWDKRPPSDWNFKKLNEDEESIMTLLESQKSKPVRFPYRANSALIFSSDLFHKTDKVEFKPGYTNKRLNITMLYGRRKDVNKWG